MNNWWWMASQQWAALLPSLFCACFPSSSSSSSSSSWWRTTSSFSHIQAHASACVHVILTNRFISKHDLQNFFSHSLHSCPFLVHIHILCTFWRLTWGCTQIGQQKRWKCLTNAPLRILSVTAGANLSRLTWHGVQKNCLGPAKNMIYREMK